MSKSKMLFIVGVIPTMMLISPQLVMASTSDDDDDDNDYINEVSTSNSDNAAKDVENKITIQSREGDDNSPAHESTRTTERGDTITIIERSSADQSSNSMVEQEIEQEIEDVDDGESGCGGSECDPGDGSGENDN